MFQESLLAPLEGISLSLVPSVVLLNCHHGSFFLGCLWLFPLRLDLRLYLNSRLGESGSGLYLLFIYHSALLSARIKL